MIKYGVLKSVGNGQVDVQVDGSARVVRNVRISSQVNWNTLAIGDRVLVDDVDGKPVVLHTILDVPQTYTTDDRVYSSGQAATITNPLLADGSVPLVGNLPVSPGVTVDGYDISLLGQTIDNLQAADSVARTGYTVMTHASHIVDSVAAADVSVKIRHNLFVDKELITVSNTNGEIENMKVVGEPVATVDNRGVPCYLYTVTRRISTSPANLVTGWAAATLVNGLTLNGYISFDARENRPATPSMRFVLHTDIDTNAIEHIVRVGSLNGSLDYTDEDYGFAIGRLTTGDRYLAYSYGENRFRIRGADIAGEDDTGTETFKIWGTYEDGRVPGDYRFGPLVGGHQEWTSESQRLSIFNGANEVIYFSPTESRFRNMIWAGSEAGPQIGIGELDGQGIIVARNALDVAQFVVRTQQDGVYVFAGNPKPQANWMEFDGGFFTFDGTVRARALEIIGAAVVGDDTSEIIIRDPADPRRYGHIKPHYMAGYSVDSTDTQYLSTLIAWAPATLEAAPGSNVWHTWLAGEAFFGDWRYRHFRIERNGRVGLFNGEDPKAYMTSVGDLELDGSLTSAANRFRVDATGISFTENASTYWNVKPNALSFMEINSSGSENYASLRVTENAGIGGYFTGGSIGVHAESNAVAGTGLNAYSESGTGLRSQTATGTAGIFSSFDSGRGIVGTTNAPTLGGVVARNTGGGPALVVETSYAYLEAGLIVNATSGSTTAHDTQIKGDTDTHLIFVDASADMVGISESAPNATFDVNGTTRLGDSDTNYSAFDTTGHLTFAGTAKPWNDMLIEPTARNTGTNAPTFEKWYDDAAGTSRGIYLYSFDDAATNSEKEVFFTLQMSHAWDGGDIQFHVHWIGAVADTTATPRWGLEYVFKEPGAVFGDSTTIYAIGNHLSEADITAHKHYISAFAAIAPGSTANDLSSVLIGRLFRNSGDAADTYNAAGAKCGLLYIDVHYQMARIGSTDEYSA